MNKLKILLDILFPLQCAACGRKFGLGAEIVICDECRSRIPIRSGFICPECGRRLPDASNPCHREFGFVLAAATDYGNSEARELLHSLKYNHIKQAAHPIAEILAYYLTELSLHHGLEFQNAILVPIPLHPRRERARGYNQTSLIARALAANLRSEIPIAVGTLVRVKHARSQTECRDYAEREKNVQGSFIAPDHTLVSGKTILLFDDVFTSGATMREAARELKRAGAKKIVGVVFAKA